MARKRKKGSGLLHGLWRAGKAFAWAFDKSAEVVANATAPKPARKRRASMEWNVKEKGGPGEHLPLTAPNLRWRGKHTAKDKEIWQASFSPGGYVHKFETWPPRDYVEAMTLAKESVVKLHGVFAESWECLVVEFVRKVVEETEDIEA